jgi:L-2-hydroxyglutarate oxidase LhgO
LTLLARDEVKKLEPNVKAVTGLLSPSTGVIDSYRLMQSFYGRAKENGVEFVFNAEVVGINRKSDCYELGIKDRDGISSITGKIVINSAGLFSDKIARMAGIDVEKAGYQIHYCKGEYFSLNPRVGRLVNRLVYPVPEQAGVGVHVTLSLDGGVRLGPNVKYIDKIDYSIDESNKMAFYQAAHRYLPSIELEDLSPDFAGIRPKLQGEGEGFRDFVIKDETDQGLPGFINLIGMESPGLTASPAIAQLVTEIVAEILK